MKKEEQKKKNHKSVFWLFGVAFLSVGLLLFCQFFYGDTISEKTVFYEGTTINGIDVSGLNQKEAENVVSAKMLENIDEVNLTLTYKDQAWNYKGSDFEVNPDISQQVQEILALGREGNIFEKTNYSKKIKKQGLNASIPYSDILTGLDKKVDDISQQINCQSEPQTLVFAPDQDVMFFYSQQTSGIQLDKEKLLALLREEFSKSNSVQIEIPYITTLPEKDNSIAIEDIAIRSTFSTSIASSSSARKHNVALALSQFNGMVVEPGQEVSFNDVTGQRSQENGYEKANIIKDGIFVEGTGGGVCQASTTLYNALLLADINVLEAHHHSLPVSYVPLSMDAMVSEGYADLVFKNDTQAPIFIKTQTDQQTASVTIFGLALDHKIKLRSELVSIIAHGGDKIVQDVSGQYDKYVLYRGEYYRLKWPKEGYESKAYLQIIDDGKVQSEREIRHDYYCAQDGVVVEGSESLAFGMNLPKSDVKLIPAQKVTEEHLQNIKNKFKNSYPDAYEM